jgi:hypothetical protein
VHLAQVVAVRYSRVAASSVPLLDTDRDARRRRPPSRRRAGPRQGVTVGVTTSSAVVAKERVSSQSPNGSVSRTDSGPTVKRPRTSEVTG